MPLTAKNLRGLSPHNARNIASFMRGLVVERRINNFSRIINDWYGPKPFSSGPYPTRFSLHSGTSPKKTTGIIYGAKFLNTAIYETVIRDRFDIEVESKRRISPPDYRRRAAVWFSSNNHLKLLDLSNGEASFYGVPSDVTKSSEHSHGQHFSRFIYDQMYDVHGIIYSSRFTETECVALFYDRTIKHLGVNKIFKLNSSLLTHQLVHMRIKV